MFQEKAVGVEPPECLSGRRKEVAATANMQVVKEAKGL